MPVGPHPCLGNPQGSPGKQAGPLPTPGSATVRAGAGTVGDVPSSRLQVRATVAGAVAGIAVTVALVVVGPLRLPTRIDRSDAQDEFLAAWERSRQGTYLVRGTFERRRPGGAVLSTPTELAQRPPSRLVRRFGGVTGMIDGRAVSCTSDTGAMRCTTAPATTTTGPPPSYDEIVQQELDAFRGWFTPAGPGQGARYRVIRAPEAGCFDLVLSVFGSE